MATKHPAATKNDHYDFCDIEGWEVVRGAKGKPVQHHVTFKLILGSGRILRTRISRPTNNKPYGAELFRHILRDQLEVTADTFWDCVKHRVVPEREAAAKEIPQHALPLGLAMELRRLGVDDEEIASLDAQSAAERLAELYAKH